jgi:anti-sigma factor RsiW
MENDSQRREGAEADHGRLQDLIAPLADGELLPAEARKVEEHLRGCVLCQRALATQRAISAALAAEPVPAASSRLRRRIEWMGEPAAPRRPSLRIRRWAAAAAAAIVVIGVCGTAALLRHGNAAQAEVVRDALADCRRATTRNFPRKPDLPAVAEGLPFPVRALDREGAELFSTWKTTLAGSPAAGLAYHWRGHVVVQYAVGPDVVGREPGIRAALSKRGFYSASDSGQGVLAVVAGGSGTLLIADGPPEELRRLIL